MTPLPLLMWLAFHLLPLCSETPTNARLKPDTLRVLFIGNSFTYFNNMPAILSTIASSQHRHAIVTRLIAKGGETLKEHWDEPETRIAVSSGRWNFVVMQEQSSFDQIFLVNGVERVNSAGETAEYVNRFATLARSAHAVPVMISHWRDQEAPAGTTSRIEWLVTRMASHARAEVAPIGRAWEHLIGAHPVQLYASDRHHPSPAGSYLVACVLYDTLTGDVCTGAASRARGAYIVPEEGTVVKDSTTLLVDLGQSTARQIQNAADWAAHCGSCRVTKPTEIALPRAPRPRDELSAAALTGNWTGKTFLYPGGPYPMTLAVTQGASGVTGQLKIFTTMGDTVIHETHSTVIYGKRRVVMVDSAGPSKHIVEYVGSLARDTLFGISSFGTPSSGFYGIGKWILIRQ